MEEKDSEFVDGIIPKFQIMALSKAFVLLT
jgi:hypothetical protein